MSDKAFKILMVVIVVSAIGAAVIFKGNQPERIRLGDEHEDQGAQHVSQAEAPEYGGEEPPTSGDHGQPVDKGAYQTELPDFNTIHNLEHGYVYVSYQPDLPQEKVDQLERLFFKPYSNEEFAPSKVIMAPRASNAAPIILSSCQRSQKFDDIDVQAMIEYYLSNVNKSPEPTAS